MLPCLPLLASPVLVPCPPRSGGLSPLWLRPSRPLGVAWLSVALPASTRLSARPARRRWCSPSRRARGASARRPSRGVPPRSCPPSPPPALARGCLCFRPRRVRPACCRRRRRRAASAVWVRVRGRRRRSRRACACRSWCFRAASPRSLRRGARGLWPVLARGRPASGSFSPPSSPRFFKARAFFIHRDRSAMTKSGVFHLAFSPVLP